MSFSRVALVLAQAIFNQRACTPPNATPTKFRYHTDELYILQIAPLIFRGHQVSLWICTIFEILTYLTNLLTSFTSPPLPLPVLCLSSNANIRTTPIFVIGVVAVALGTYIRLDCFHALGHLFTFDLTVLPEHKLVTERFYAYVRHPAYSGSLLLVAGIAFSHLTRGSWLTECGPLSAGGSAAVVWALWWAYMGCVGVSRAVAEDKEMKKLFHGEWEAYAANVPWWFFPGLI